MPNYIEIYLKCNVIYFSIQLLKYEHGISPSINKLITQL